MKQRRVYHGSVARAFLSDGRIEDAERHLDALAVLTFVLKESQ